MPTQASPMDLSSLAETKAWIPINGTGNDSIIQLCLTAASIEWLRLTGRGSADPSLDTQNPFNELVTYSETYDGTGNPRLFLRNAPIASVSSVVVSGATVNQVQSGNGFGFMIDGSKKSIVLRGGFAGIGVYPNGFSWGGVPSTFTRGWQRGVQNVAVTYAAGYPAKAINNELQTIPANPGPYMLTTVYGQWLSNTGVVYFSDGTPLTEVQTAPAQGQYFIVSPGVYLFNAVDAGVQVLLSYNISGTPPDVKQAVQQMVALNYKRRDWVGQRSIAQETVGSTSYTTWALDESVRLVISTYKRVAITG